MAEPNTDSGTIESAFESISLAEDVQNGTNGKANGYSESDIGPYIVLARKKNAEFCHASTIKRLLLEEKIEGFQKVITKGKNLFAVEFSNAADANSLHEHPNVDDWNIQFSIPSRPTTSQGVVHVDTSITDEDLQSGIGSDKYIIGTRRIKKLSKSLCEANPTMAVVLTFGGSKIPAEVRLLYKIYKVQPYVPPVIQCFHCLRFAHGYSTCKGKERCPRCGKYTHENHTRKNCTEKIKCLYCWGSHLATDSVCKEFKRQKKINQKMATENYTYYEAEKRIPRLRSMNYYIEECIKKSQKKQKKPSKTPALPNE